ncbi:hypothetical protein K435DRAFT_865106 [Dendrothele bispora CBS 962.96]|uniref:Myb-like domain-containing protein n=1 Tax=Dendrothele bispora (strain CBS 962.96) TaxID=1314807 RepID=A0A4V4HE47_DENBC|nr:hypothetical protein K435DRAFT_865106 [Dendrothele bispora CBS 962.96]
MSLQTGESSPIKEPTTISKFQPPSSSTFSFKAPFPAPSPPTSSITPLKQRRISLALPSSPRQVPAWSFRDDTSLATSNSPEACLVPEKSGKLRRIGDDEDVGGVQEKKQRKKWTAEETQMLVDGCNKHGVGNWKVILSDPSFKFDGRSPVDLKDRFRTYFPDAYKQHYPNARTHLSSKVRSTLPDGTSLFEKTRSKKRRPFTEEEDRALKAGYEKHGTVWATIVKDPIFQEQKRRSTDLRDRFRNAFPELYQAAGYKPRNAKKKVTGDSLVARPSTSAGKMPMRAATDDQLSMTTKGTVRRRRNTSQGLLRGGVKSVPQSAAASEDEDSSEDEAESPKPRTASFSSVWVKPPPSSSPPELEMSRSTSTMDDDTEMNLVDASMNLSELPGHCSSEVDAHSQTWSSGLDTPVHSHATWAGSPTSSQVSNDYLVGSPFQGRNESIVGGMGMIGKSAWGTHDWFSANPRLDNSGTSTSSSSYIDGLSPSSPFAFNNHGVFDRYDLVSGFSSINSEVGTGDSWSTFSDDMFPPTHSDYAGDLISGARSHQPQTNYWAAGFGRGLASLGEENGLGLVGLTGAPGLPQSTGIHPMELHTPALPGVDEIELSSITLDDRQQSDQSMDDSAIDLGIMNLNSPRKSDHHHNHHLHSGHRDFHNRDYNSHQRSQSVMSDTRISFDDFVDFSNEPHSTPPGTPFSQPRPLRKNYRSGSDGSHMGGHHNSSHGRSVSVPPTERTAPTVPTGSQSPPIPTGRPHMRTLNSHPDLLSSQMRPSELSAAMYGSQSLLRQEQQTVSVPPTASSSIPTTPGPVLPPPMAHSAQPTFSSLFLSSQLADVTGTQGVVSSQGQNQPMSDIYEIPFLDLHYNYGGSGANGLGIFPVATPWDGAQNSRQALDLAQSNVSSSFKSTGMVNPAVAAGGQGQAPLTPSLSRREAGIASASEMGSRVAVGVGDVLKSAVAMQTPPSTVSMSSLSLSLSSSGRAVSTTPANHHRGQSAVCPQDLVLRNDNKRKRASWDGAHM